VLCDFGAAFLYDRHECGALEALEVRAFGLLLSEIAQRLPAEEDSASAEVTGRLNRLASECTGPLPAERPMFNALAKRIVC